MPDDAMAGRRPAGSLPDPASVDRPWVASYPPGVPTTYDYPPVALTRFLDDAAQDFPDTVAVEFLGAELTYRELLDRVDRFATALRHLGVGPGDRVGLILPNCPQHVIAFLATLRVGAVVAEHSPLLGEAQLEDRLNDAGCKAVVCLEPVYRRLANLKGRLPAVAHVVATGFPDALPFPRSLLHRLRGRHDGSRYRIPGSEGVLRFAELIERTPPTATQAEVDPSAGVAAIFHTGRGGGAGRGVALTHANLVANAFQTRLWIPDIQAGRERILGVMPFAHPFGLTTVLTLGLLSAATLTLLPRFDRDLTLRTIARARPTLFPAVPTVYGALTSDPDVERHDLTSVRVCLSGAAELPGDLAGALERATGGKVRESYGLVETSPITHANPIYGKAKPGTVGLPLPDTVCVLVDPDDPGRLAAPGAAGELAVAGPQVMLGYWSRPAETAAALPGGWLLTGDIARMDAEGYVTIVDRKTRTVGGTGTPAPSSSRYAAS